MSHHFSLIRRVAAVLLVAAAGAAHAAPQDVVKLPRVVITGKSVAAPVVEARQVVQLPRVVVSGVSLRTQLQLSTLAAAKPATRGI